jgi:ComF family protein
MLLNALTDLLFPRACTGCGAPAPEASRYFCWDCLSSLAVIRPPFCRLCGDPADGALEGDYLCAGCLSHPPAFDLARSAMRYRGMLQNALQDFKYNGATWLSRDFAMFLMACLQTHYADIPIDTLTYVPLFPAKERTRSYNQSCLLARDLSARLHGPAVKRLLVKLRPTQTQTHLTAPRRRANVRDSFAISEESAVAGQRLLLIDDVMTTGATVHECARMLKLAGAAKVYVLTVARG